MNWWYVFSGLLIFLLFVGGPDADSHRVYQEIWDTGHVLLFASLSWGLLRLPVLQARRWIEQFLIISGFCLVAGFAVEVLQLFVNRNFEIKDLVNDLLGGYLGLLIFTAQQLQRQLMLKVVIYSLMLAIIVGVLLPTIFAIVDEYIMQEEFPVLADFETPYELGRWDNNLASLSIVDKIFRHGKKSMQVDFYAGEYPDIALKHFPRDWHGFSAIKFSIFNTAKKDLLIELKIYDQQHKPNGYKYSDRFNRVLTLKPGWNDFLIAMEDISSAPENRKMDLTDIASLSLFLHDLKQPVTLYFDGLMLVGASL